VAWVNAQHSFTCLVRALPSSPLPSRPSVSAAIIGTPVPSIAIYSLSGSGPGGGRGTRVRAVIAAAWAWIAAAAAMPPASAWRPGRLPVSSIPASSPARPAPGANGTAAPARALILASPGDIVWPATPSPASLGARPCPQAWQ